MKFRLFLTMMLICAGCATHVYPPASPKNPTTIYICDYGIHSSLLLPTGDGQFVEYVYGDWDYAALNKTDPLHTLGALAISCQPALGRRFLRPPPGQHVPEPPNRPITIDPLMLDGDLVKLQVQHLDQRYHQHIETAHLNEYPDYFFTFVYDDQHYYFLHNCNSLTGENLADMGCTVAGFPILSNFIVMPPRHPVTPP